MLSFTFLEQPGINNTVFHNNFFNNIAQIKNSPNSNDSLIIPAGSYDNGKEGNYWSDYNGTDANNDGIGDSPYVIDPFRTDNYPLIAPFDIENNVKGVPSPTPSIRPNDEIMSPETPIIIAAIAVVSAVAVVSLLLYFRHRKITNQT